MDKNQRIGILLIFATIIAYYFYSAPTAEQIQRHQEIQDSLQQVQLLEAENPVARAPISETKVPDSVRLQNLNSNFGPFSSAMVGESQIVTLENEKIILSLDTKGGKISKVLIKDHLKIVEDSAHNQTKEPLYLLEDSKNKFEYILPTQRYGNISTDQLFFAAQSTSNSVSLTATIDGGKTITQTYSINPNSYKLDYSIKLNGMDQLLSASDKALKFKWHNYLDKLELNHNFERYYTTVYFKETNESSDYCNCRSDAKEETEEKRLQWVSNVNQFFNTSIIADSHKFVNGVFETVSLEKDDEDLKLLKSEYDIPLDLTSTEQIDMKLYIGPNEYNDLQGYGEELEQIIPFGRSIFGSINRHLIRPAFNWLSGFIGSKGVVIIVMIFILKMLLYPLMYKMLHSQAKMGALKPELAGLKEKFKGDAQKAQMETMKVYREYGVSPLGGCMPMILQMPIWYALFRFFPASITFRQEPFLWATDLSSYDVIAWLPFELPAFGAHLSLFTILWAVSTIVYSYYNMKHMDMSANPAMKYIQYFMPITFLVFFNTYASGLTCYMFFSNLFNIAQTVITKKFVFNDEKILKELHTQKAKPKKKGGFSSRLEEAMQKQKEITEKRNQAAANQKKKKRK